MILIKPHHLIDIIKLHGAGIKHFVPDEAFQHDFYRVANDIVENLDAPLRFTIYGDDICRPCNRFKNSQCIDSLDNISGYKSKDIYNQEIDSRLINLLRIDVNVTYTVWQFIEIVSSHKDIIFNVWLEEDNLLTEKRDNLFQEGLKQIMSNA